MKVTYGMVVDAIYVYVSGNKVARTVEAENTMLIDMDKKGGIVGFEILNASAQKELVTSLKKDTRFGIPVTIEQRAPVLV